MPPRRSSPSNSPMHDLGQTAIMRQRRPTSPPTPTPLPTSVSPTPPTPWRFAPTSATTSSLPSATPAARTPCALSRCSSARETARHDLLPPTLESLTRDGDDLVIGVWLHTELDGWTTVTVKCACSGSSAADASSPSRFGQGEQHAAGGGCHRERGCSRPGRRHLPASTRFLPATIADAGRQPVRWRGSRVARGRCGRRHPHRDQRLRCPRRST